MLLPTNSVPFEEAKRRFSINYYSWSKAELQKEFESDFPFLKTISSCKSAVEFFRQLSDGQQLVAISAFSKRGHADVVGPIEEAATKEEVELLRNYLAFRRQAIVRASDDDMKDRRGFDRVAFTRNVEAEVGPILGRLIEKGGQLYRRYSREFETFSVETTVHTGGRAPQLQYEHKLLAPEGIIREHISILSWLGIIWGPTHWRRVGDDTSEAVIEACKSVCSIFINAAPKLVEQRA